MRARLVVMLICATAPAAAQPTRGAGPPAGATACSGCHAPARPGVAPGAIPPLHGLSVGEIAAAMAEYRSGARSATVMDRIAKGFSEEETRAIAAWLGGRP